jgi:frataxin
MLSRLFPRFVCGFQAFKNDAEYKTKVSEILFELGDHLTSKYEHLGDDMSIDVEEESLLLAAKGRQFLLSRQTPSRQIWFSSPISGSVKFDYDDVVQRWVDHKQPTNDIKSLLERDIDAVISPIK